MEHITYKICKLENNSSFDNASEDLKIANYDILFLRDILLKNCQFKLCGNKDWKLTFFVGKSYEQSFLITKANNKLSCLSTLSVIIDKVNDFNGIHAENLSLAVRDNKSLKREMFTEYSSHYCHIDGKGICFFSKIDGQKCHFERHIILQSLAYAYLGAIEFITAKLAEKISSENYLIEELNELYIEAAKFNSVFFFHQPVLIKNTGLTEAWKNIDKALDVNISSDELFEQLSNIHYILNLEAEKKKSDIDKQYQINQNKQNTKFTIIGIIIGILGLIELFK